MKYLWFFGCLAFFIKGVVLTYAAATGLIVGAEAPHMVAGAVATAFMGFGCFLLWPWSKS